MFMFNKILQTIVLHFSGKFYISLGQVLGCLAFLLLRHLHPYIRLRPLKAMCEATNDILERATFLKITKQNILCALLQAKLE